VLRVSAQAFVGNRISVALVLTGPATIPGGPPQYTLLDADPIPFRVQPLPRESQLPGFTGAIGAFAVDPPVLATNILRVGDLVKLTIRVRGQANLARLVAPLPPQARDWQVFAAPTDNPAPPNLPGTAPNPLAPGQSAVALNYTLIPLTEQARATPAIPFSCFDPKKGRYVDLTIPPVAVTVKAGAALADITPLLQASASDASSEKEPVLSKLATAPGLAAGSLAPLQQQAWFPLLQLAPAAAFLGLWKWDRRRRYLEAHPDLVLRRRARRALRRVRRALRRAAREGAAARFAAVAADALRIACAPHYPAEPRALVCGDVLPLLPEADRAGRAGEVVRRIFAAADALLFSGTPENVAELLTLQTDFERVLDALEAKL
jgi:hypothetical protein